MIFWIFVSLSAVSLVIALLLFSHAAQEEDDIADDLAHLSDALAGFTLCRTLFRGWEYSITGRWFLLFSIVFILLAGLTALLQ
ncbi:MAG: hypothetical protein SynsKO_30110 [Synoicihabitans sp.]